jgi:group I intron endonuclease
MFVYKITNTVNDRVYIGLTTGSIAKRWREHCCSANIDVDKPLYRAMRKHGIDKFSIHVIYTTDSVDDLRAAEIRFIDEFKAHTKDNGYNLTDHGFCHGRTNQLRGSQTHNAKLTEEIVAFIRNPMHWDKNNATVLEMVKAQFGFDGARDTIRDARRGDIWKHLNDRHPPVKVTQGSRKSPMTAAHKATAIAILKANHAKAVQKAAEIRRNKRGANAKLSEEKVKEIFYSPLSLLKTAEKHGVSKKMVLLIKQRKAHVYLTKGL